MAMRLQSVVLARSVGISSILTALTLLSSSTAFAQDHDRSSPTWAVVKQVVLDPTTYAPTLVDYGAARLDWRSSQLLFRHGFLEHNPEFTVSGFGDDVPISYGAGNRKLLAAAVVNLRFSLINNGAAAVIPRSPEAVPDAGLD